MSRRRASTPSRRPIITTPPQRTGVISPSCAMRSRASPNCRSISSAVQPTPAQRATLDELKDASTKAAEGFNIKCPTYHALTPSGRVEARENRLDATLAAVKPVQPALAKFSDSLSDEQKARFNSLRSSSRPLG